MCCESHDSQHSRQTDNTGVSQDRIHSPYRQSHKSTPSHKAMVCGGNITLHSFHFFFVFFLRLSLNKSNHQANWPKLSIARSLMARCTYRRLGYNELTFHTIAQTPYPLRRIPCRNTTWFHKITWSETFHTWSHFHMCSFVLSHVALHVVTLSHCHIHFT